MRDEGSRSCRSARSSPRETSRVENAAHLVAPAQEKRCGGGGGRSRQPGRGLKKEETGSGQQTHRGDQILCVNVCAGQHVTASCAQPLAAVHC